MDMINVDANKPTDDKKQKQVVTKVTVSPKTMMEFYRTSVWSMKTLSLSDNENVTGNLMLTLTIQIMLIRYCKK